MAGHEAQVSTPDQQPLDAEVFSTPAYLKQETMRIDLMIESAQAAILDPGRNPVHTVAQLTTAQLKAANVMESVPPTIENFTDYHRLATTAQFAMEKILLPLLFRSNTAGTQHLRKELVNGAEGKSVEIVEILLSALDQLPDRAPIEIRKRIRGGLQESTITALINEPQDGLFVALPSSLVEDTKQNTDLNIYYFASDGNSYCVPTSIKTLRSDALKEKEKHPHLLVLCAEDIGNLHLTISKLLVRQHSGDALTPDEQDTLARAQQNITDQINQQLPHITGEPLPNQPPSQDLLQIMQLIPSDYALNY